MSDVPEHVNRIIQSHQKVVDLIRSLVISHDHFKDEREQRSYPINETASCRLLHNLFPIRHDLKSLAQISNLTELFWIENFTGHQIEAMINDSSSHEVMASLMTFINGGKQIHHIFKELSSLVPLPDVVDSFHDNLINDLTGISIDQNNPLVYNMLFCPELYLYGF
jgi:hypothetical protein